VPRIGVDGVAEQQELDERDHDDHRERDTIALELDELLDQHRPGPTKEIGTARCGGCRRHAHWKLSFALPMRAMKTSSSDGVDCVQGRPGRSRSGAIAASSAAGSRPETCRLVPKGATMSMPGRRASSSPRSARLSPLPALMV